MLFSWNWYKDTGTVKNVAAAVKYAVSKNRSHPMPVVVSSTQVLLMTDFGFISCFEASFMPAHLLSLDLAWFPNSGISREG